jgi:hypothetical protein
MMVDGGVASFGAERVDGEPLSDGVGARRWSGVGRRQVNSRSLELKFPFFRFLS